VHRAALIAVIAVAACHPPAGERASASSSSDAATRAAASTASTPAAPSGSAPTTLGAGGAGGASARPPFAPQPFAFTPGTSKVPTVKEWNLAPVVEVRFARSLWCEAKTVREWLRVSCRSPDGAPNAIEAVTRDGGSGEAYTFVGEGIASAVVAVRRGTDVRLTYRWSRWGQRALTVNYPRDADGPRIGFDRGAPRGRSGLPRCDDVCIMPFHHHAMGACERPPPCDPGYRCEMWHEDGEVTGMCVCDVECDPGDPAPEGTRL
jgi:hypothetical protein